jgi:hypothetical protein
MSSACPIAPGQVSPRLIKTGQRLDTIIISSDDVALSRDDFNIRGNTGLEAPSRSLNLLSSQRQPKFGHIHRLFGSIQLIQSRPFENVDEDMGIVTVDRVRSSW